MQPPDPLFPLLDILSRALDDGTDLNAVLAVLIDDLQAAVASFLGFTLVVPVDDELVSFNLMSDASAASSILIPLPFSPRGSPGTGHIVLYSAAAGAFAELAAQTRRAYGLDGWVQVDAHRAPGGGGPGNLWDWLTSRSDINQAIGVLIESGFVPEAARVELQERADRAGSTVHQAARAVLDKASPHR